MPSFSAVATVLATSLWAASGAWAQVAYEEPTSGVTYKVAIPEVDAAPFDMIVSIEAPASAGWAGFAAGGCMLRSPILVAWPNGNSTVVSPRWATAYHPPALYNGTTAKVLSSSTSNSTHWTASVLCTGCSKWDGGALDPKGNATFGWGVSSHAVDSPSNPASSIRFHDVGKSHFEVDLSQARLSKDNFDALLKTLGG
ncbi:hypothetical protein VTK73DRAFT_7981 [Phialemonium thermophilum]|uniref:Cellobiose dehydrogenase-like cytochrome domain-containing protein n=1 Tax=Phialemonium thermophilum TaxID=223376 RepID=A0ABR3WBF3_9PEZI